MQSVPNADAPHIEDSAKATASDRAAARRRWITRAAVFGGSVLAVLAVASPAMAWPAMGC